MSLQQRLDKCAVSVDEVVTYLGDSYHLLGRLDLGSAEVLVVRNKEDIEKAMLIVTTSSGHSVAIPAALFAGLV